MMATPLPLFSQQVQQPLAGIESPHENDVLCGRGVTTNRHIGNENFRSLVNCNKELYVTSTKRQKMTISRSIVEAVRTLDPPGRFLEKDNGTGRWYDIGDKKAVEKTSQALRDGAACLRKQLSEDLSDPDFLSAVFDMDEEKFKDTKPKEKPNAKEKKAKAKQAPAKGHRRTKSNPLESSAAKAKAAANVKKQRQVELPVSPRATQKQRHSLHLPQISKPPQSPISTPSSPAYVRSSSLTLQAERSLSFGGHASGSPESDGQRFFRHGRFTFDGPGGGISSSGHPFDSASPSPMSTKSSSNQDDAFLGPPQVESREMADRRHFSSSSYPNGGPRPRSPPSPSGNRMKRISPMAPPPSGPLPPGIHRLSPAGYQQETLTSPRGAHRAPQRSPYGSGGSRSQSLTPLHYIHPSDRGDFHGDYQRTQPSPRNGYGGPHQSASGLTVPKLGGEPPHGYSAHGGCLPMSPVQVGSGMHRQRPSHLRHRPHGHAPRPRPEFMPPPPTTSSPRRMNERVLSASPRASHSERRPTMQQPHPPPSSSYREPQFYPRNTTSGVPVNVTPQDENTNRQEQKVAIEPEDIHSETTLFVSPPRKLLEAPHHETSSPSGVVDAVEVILSEEVPELDKHPSRSPIMHRKSSKDNDLEENPASDIDDEDVFVSPLPFDSSSFFEDQDEPASLMDLPENILKMPISPCGPNDVS